MTDYNEILDQTSIMKPRFPDKSNSSAMYFDEFGCPMEPVGELIKQTTVTHIFMNKYEKTQYGTVLAVYYLFVKGPDGKMHLYHKTMEYKEKRFYDNYQRFANEDDLDESPPPVPADRHIFEIAKMMQMSY